MFRLAGFSASLGLATAAHQACDSAMVLFNGVNTSGFKTTFTTDNFTNLCQAAGDGNLYKQLYFSYTPTCTGWGRMKTRGINGASTDKRVAAASGVCSNLTLINVTTGINPETATLSPRCPDDGTNDETLQFRTTLGSEIKLVIGQYSDIALAANFSIEVGCATPASGKTFALAEEVKDGVTISRSNYATTNAVAMPGAIVGGFDAAYFKYTSPCTGNVTVTVDTWSGTSLYTGIYKSAADTYGYFTTDDSFDLQTQSSITSFSKKGVTGGSTYYIAVSTLISASSTYQTPFSLTVGPCMGTPGGASAASALAVPALAIVALVAFL